MKNTQLTLKEIATLTQSTLIGDADLLISNVADLESAEKHDASFLSNSRYEQAMRHSKAGVVFIHPQIEVIKDRNFLINDNPSAAFQKLVDLFYGHDQLKTGFKSIHPTSVIHPTAKIGQNVEIGPHAVIDQDVVIGQGTFVGAGTYIGPKSTVGENCYFYPRVTIRENSSIGNRVHIQPGAVIGSCGFGYITDKNGHHNKLNQVGNVIIEDDVEIGANTTIDRARFKSTKISRGTKIDNLVQVGHGVVIGQDNIIVSQTGIAGSTETGRHVIFGGKVAVNGHIKICDNVMISALSGISKSIQKSGKYGGIPAVELDEYNRNAVYLRRIEKLFEDVKTIKHQLSTK